MPLQNEASQQSHPQPGHTISGAAAGVDMGVLKSKNPSNLHPETMQLAGFQARWLQGSQEFDTVPKCLETKSWWVSEQKSIAWHQNSAVLSQMPGTSRLVHGPEGTCPGNLFPIKLKNVEATSDFPSSSSGVESSSCKHWDGWSYSEVILV